MSWSVTGNKTPYDLAHWDRLSDLKDHALQQNPECADQFDAAAAAVAAIIQSGAVGPPSHTFAVTMAGHSNPGHGPREGWASDCITVSVSHETLVIPE